MTPTTTSTSTTPALPTASPNAAPQPAGTALDDRAAFLRSLTGSATGAAPAATAASSLDQLRAALAAGDPTSDVHVTALQLVDRLSPYAPTMSADDTAFVRGVIEQANATGRLSSIDVARARIRVEGHALGMPEEYLQAAEQRQLQLARVDAKMQEIEADVMHQLTASDGDPNRLVQLLQQLDSLSEYVLQQQRSLFENYQLAKHDPVRALRELQGQGVSVPA